MQAKVPRESGQAIILMTLSSVVVVGMIGLVVDLGWAEFRKLNCQAASQAAAMAAVKVAKNATNFTCGSGVTCQGNTACPATLSDPNNALQVACMYAQQNGFTNGGKQGVMLAANVTSPPVTGVSPTYWVSATVSETIPTGFAAVLGHATVTVAARSTAAIFASPEGGCIFALNPTASNALSGGGTTSISSGCGVYVDSNASDAVGLNGGGLINTTGTAKTNIVGNCSGCANISPAPIVGAPVFADPFASMPAPTIGSCLAGISLSGHSTKTITPGTYCGSPAVNLTGQSQLTLGMGTYVFQGGLNMAGGTTLTTTGGVMLYFPSGSVNLAGGAIVSLSGQTTGPYKGVLMWQDKADTNGASLVGGSAQFLNGALYFPKATLSFTGGTSAAHTNTTIVADKLSLVGNSYIQSAADTLYTGSSLLTWRFWVRTFPAPQMVGIWQVHLARQSRRRQLGTEALRPQGMFTKACPDASRHFPGRGIKNNVQLVAYSCGCGFAGGAAARPMAVSHAQPARAGRGGKPPLFHY